jgi:hypothetical protein
MKARWTILVLLTVSLHGAELTPSQLYGRWTVTAIATAGPVTAMSGDEAAHLVGRSVVITPDKFKFAGTSCSASYASSISTPQDVAVDYKVSVSDLGLPDQVQRFDADCTEVLIQSPDTIIFSWEGYLLRAVRSPSAHKASSHEAQKNR